MIRRRLCLGEDESERAAIRDSISPEKEEEEEKPLA